jgi:cytochrome P450 family 110
LNVFKFLEAPMVAPLPGPRSRIATTRAILVDPYNNYRLWRERYGDTFLLRAMNGDVVASCDPGFVSDFFKLGHEESRPFGADATAPLVGRGSLLLLSGAAHRRERRLLTPPFHGERMRSYADVIQRAADREIASWEGEIRAAEATRRVSLAVIIRAVFGVTSQDREALYNERVRAMVDALNPIFLFFRALQVPLFGLSPWDRFLAARHELRTMLAEDVRRAREAGGGADILSLLVNATYEDGALMADEHIIDELVTLLFAGHETTQTALAWAIYWVFRDPEELAKLRAELDPLGGDADAVSRAPRLDAVVNEALRLNPIVPDVLRTLTVEKAIGGRTYPAGTHLAVLTAMLHQREDLYPDPLAFRPDRWADSRPRPTTFTPFGGGVRRCIGAALAIYEIKLVLDRVVRGVDLEVLGEERAARTNAAMAPRDGVRVRVVGRRTG